MRDTAGHLTDHFHFLRLLEGRLGLPTFSDLLAQLCIRLFELTGPLADQDSIRGGVRRSKRSFHSRVRALPDVIAEREGL